MQIIHLILLLINFIITFIIAFDSSLPHQQQQPQHPHILPKAKFSAFDSLDFCSQIITPTCNTTFSYIDNLNNEIRPYLSNLVKTSYFKYFKLNLDKQCKFWNAQHFCATENCAVEILEDFEWDNITNENLKPSKLGKIITSSSLTEENSIETEVPETCEDLDYSHIDDDHNCVYVNLLNNPERFTGYGGNQSLDVWKAIYSENCFPNTNPMSMKPNEPKEKCIEKNLFYRLVSGMHASIAVHLSNEYLNIDTGEFYPNLKIFMQRVGLFNDRLSNIYFNYALVSEAVVKLNEILPIKQFIQSGYDDITPSEKHHLLENNNNTTTKKEDDIEIYDELLIEDIIPALQSNTLFNTSKLFENDPNLKNEFRSRFKNISAIMDCVGCDRCRMWGKIQIIGYGTALKILFENDNHQNQNLKFKRIEIVALINTLDRLSKSIESINNFKKMYMKHLKDVELGIVQPGDFDNENKFKTNQGFNFPFVNSLSSSSSSSLSSSSKQLKKSSTQSNSKSSSHNNNNQLKKPTIKELYKIHPKDRTFKQEFQLAFNEVWEALKFVLTSYKNFPLLMVKISLYQLNNWWNEFIGKPQVYEYKSPIDIEAENYSRLINE
ncbi:ERO1 [Candida pseudojiufengensis]|uniref:ERO1 n=1 Tax=Candida pseudojiufengensis TaxID=497109 RepID=UPI00222467F9|nr:ERO1 [Candida pseudojiufengensis]KAI5961388.1 ERO1 [Candida pseudojiufengensis]